MAVHCEPRGPYEIHTFQQWRNQYPYGSDAATRNAAKPYAIQRAEFELGVMERFNYQSLDDMRRESGELMRLLELEYWGIGKDREEAQAQQEAQLASQQNGM